MINHTLVRPPRGRMPRRGAHEKKIAALKALTRADKYIRQSLLNNASKELIVTLTSFLIDVIKGRIPLTRAQLNKLRPFEKVLKKFTSSKTTLAQKRTIINEEESGQKGGLFGAVIPTILKTILGAVL